MLQINKTRAKLAETTIRYTLPKLVNHTTSLILGKFSATVYKVLFLILNNIILVYIHLIVILTIVIFAMDNTNELILLLLLL